MLSQKGCPCHLASVWGRWEAGWYYYHYRFTGISAPRSSAYPCSFLELLEVVTTSAVRLVLHPVPSNSNTAKTYYN